MNDFKCADCGTEINSGEFKTFGVCDACWDKHHKKPEEQDAAHSFEHDENECVFYLDNESVVFGCECGNIEIGGKIYYPEEKLTRLRSELQQERELRKELVVYVVAYHRLSSLTSNEDIYIRSLIKKAKLNN